MTKSQLIEKIAASFEKIPKKHIETAVDAVFEAITDAMKRSERVEIRGIGSFTVKERQAREGRNPKTGEKVSVPRRRVPFFTVGKALKDRVNSGKGK